MSVSDDVEFQSPIPWGLVEHVHRTKTGRTTMQISLPIELRARLARAALDLGCSKLALIRVAISRFLLAHEAERVQCLAVLGPGQSACPGTGQEPSSLATSEAPSPVPGGTPSSATVVVPEPESEEPEPEPEPEPALEPVTKKATVPTPVAKKPPAAGAAPTTKKPRAKKEKAI